MMVPQWFVALMLAALVVLVTALVVAIARRPRREPDVLEARLAGFEKLQERTERALRDDLAQAREESGVLSRGLREELNGALRSTNDSMVRGLVSLAEGNERRLELLRETIEQRLSALQAENASKLEEMRATVDDRLHGTLEAKLGESFQRVSERLEQVHRGLGEMQSLAAGVGDLKRVLSNVKSRGALGETQLRALLEQGLAPEQYGTNVATREGSSERVEFAIRLPGLSPQGDSVWLPVDAKFPLEDYQRLTDAMDRGDTDGAEAASRQLEARLKVNARDIRDKYINPPVTTDFAVLFLPTEGLFGEVLRRPGLFDFLQRECRVVVAGPTTLWAILCSLQMGFRTLAIQRRSGEVWRLLANVKLEFARFGDALDVVQKKLGEATNKIDQARRGTRSIQRRLDEVQSVAAPETGADETLDAVQLSLGADDEE
ncbi:MAG: DNA recombination protein RmuC [Vicinamibacterales bacterium]